MANRDIEPETVDWRIGIALVGNPKVKIENPEVEEFEKNQRKRKDIEAIVHQVIHMKKSKKKIKENREVETVLKDIKKEIIVQHKDKKVEKGLLAKKESLHIGKKTKTRSWKDQDHLLLQVTKHQRKFLVVTHKELMS